MVPWVAVLLYLALALPQLHLPGLHYDEAKEAGVNAMEMLLRQDVQAFRAAGLQAGTVFLPLMVQDYIGALNVYLALPFLALFGITVPALRLLALSCGLLTLVLVGRLGQELGRFTADGKEPGTTPGHGMQAGSAGPIAMLLLAVSPSFIFWSRQGVFVTNVVVTLAVASVWMGLRWWRQRRPRDLYLLAILAGLGLWAKLLFVWVLGAMAGVVVAAWLLGRWRRGRAGMPVSNALIHPPLEWSSLLLAVLLFLLALSPLILFNQQTAGTWRAIFANLGQSYYGVENAAFLDNLQVRLGQVGTLLRGDHLWYLGGPFASALVPWIALILLAGGLLVAGLGYRQRQEGQPLATLLLTLLFVLLLLAQSAFTISDLFITHLAIVQPFLVLSLLHI
jgi:4-amino-4-deoxy-L-arabinose transferase-like glycosyltransferase